MSIDGVVCSEVFAKNYQKLTTTLIGEATCFEIKLMSSVRKYYEVSETTMCLC